MKTDCIVKSAFHVVLTGVALYEVKRLMRRRSTLIEKIAVCGFLFFHADAALADAMDRPTAFHEIFNGGK